MGRLTRTVADAVFAASLALAVLGVTRADAAPLINVGMNQAVRIPIGGSVANVVVTNPAIADVTVVDAHNVIVIGKAYGLSEVMVLDVNGRLLLDNMVNVAAPTESVLTVYRGATPSHFFCAPRCEALTPPSQNGSAPGASTPSS
jgi:Flp pilus assembly secretin CpaC